MFVGQEPQPPSWCARTWPASSLSHPSWPPSARAVGSSNVPLPVSRSAERSRRRGARACRRDPCSKEQGPPPRRGVRRRSGRRPSARRGVGARGAEAKAAAEQQRGSDDGCAARRKHGLRTSSSGASCGVEAGRNFSPARARADCEAGKPTTFAQFRRAARSVAQLMDAPRTESLIAPSTPPPAPTPVATPSPSSTRGSWSPTSKRRHDRYSIFVDEVGVYATLNTRRGTTRRSPTTCAVVPLHGGRVALDVVTVERERGCVARAS